MTRRAEDGPGQPSPGRAQGPAQRPRGDNDTTAVAAAATSDVEGAADGAAAAAVDAATEDTTTYDLGGGVRVPFVEEVDDPECPATWLAAMESLRKARSPGNRLRCSFLGSVVVLNVLASVAGRGFRVRAPPA